MQVKYKFLINHSLLLGLTTPPSQSLAMTQDTLWGLMDKNPTVTPGKKSTDTSFESKGSIIMKLGLSQIKAKFLVMDKLPQPVVKGFDW
ncbi:hypothetical protein DSO57_1020119 [Entomophthora muscae]|uniref:Uncharacterized protein n=1 Tax=Entomophthora muscae TaxID=34485 RepID=A0ACC2ST11_9FUNG|nr:hypothetical protein DSO57_1020119 [Entomophthora muscae]